MSWRRCCWGEGEWAFAPGLTPSSGGGRFTERTYRAWCCASGSRWPRLGPAGHLWIPACAGMTGVRARVVWWIRGLAQGNSLGSLGFARDDKL